MPVVSVNGERIHYQQSGAGPVVAFIHDVGASARVWKKQIEALKTQYTSVAIDCRGHGQSSANGPITVADAANDLKAVLDHIGVIACHLVGIGMGGAIGLSYAAAWPNRVTSLVLANYGAEPDEKAVENVIAIREALAYISMQEFGIQYAAEHLMATTGFDIQDELAADIAQLSPKVYIDALQSARLDQSASVLQHISAPVLILVGECDPLISKPVAEQLARNIDDAQLEIIANAGHLSNLDNPAAFNAALRRFLDVHGQTT